MHSSQNTDQRRGPTESRNRVPYNSDLLTTRTDIGFTRETMRSGICVLLRVGYNAAVTPLS